MFTKNRILGVNGRSINVDHAAAKAANVAQYVGRDYQGRDKHKMTASMSMGTLGGGPSMSVNGFWQSNYQYYMTGIIPADPHLIDTSTLALFYRDIYMFDNTAGSAVDILSTFGFSDWELRGLETEELKFFEDALQRLQMQSMMPLISVAHLTDGFFCGSLVFDPRDKQFITTMLHDALSCAVIPSPFYTMDPTINVRVGQATQQFMHDTSDYARKFMRTMPQKFVEMLKSGAFTLDPLTTLFVPRRSTTDRAYTSYLHRILPMYLIEKTLFRGTLVEAQRRQRAMTHVTAGDDVWTPSTEELNQFVHTFQAAEYDPLGGWVATRNAVQATDIRPGGDFWKWTDMADILVAYKLRALGISESFLSGDASYASAESAYSTFLESQNAYRTDLTNRIFYTKLFPLIAIVNNLYKEKTGPRARHGEILEFLYNNNSRANLKMPELHWHKELEAKGEENMSELLEQASAKGVPIPLKMWMAAAKIDPESLLRDLEEDNVLRKKLEKYTGKDTSHEGEDDYNVGEFDDEGDFDDISPGSSGSGGVSPREEQARLRQRVEGFTSQSFHSLIRNPRVPLLAREFDSENSDAIQLSKTGKLKYVPEVVQAQRRRDANSTIMKIARAADRDPNYREQLKRRNIEKLGRATLAGVPRLTEPKR